MAEGNTGEQCTNSIPWLVPFQFKPGQSGNPKGRPKGSSFATRLREYVEQELIDGQEIMDVIVQRLVTIAVTGDDGVARQAINDISDRLDGKPTVEVKTTGPDVKAAVRKAKELRDRRLHERKPGA